MHAHASILCENNELYLPALLGGLEQVSAIREAAGGDSRRGDSAAPAATELNYMETFIEKYLMKKDGWQITAPKLVASQNCFSPSERRRPRSERSTVEP